MKPPFNVLILCTGNSARSILAEAILGRLGGERFRAHSAGSQPTGRVNPLALALLHEKGFETKTFRSKSWDAFEHGPVMDLVITVCDSAASESCPIWPGRPLTVHWGIPDPAAATGDDTTRRAAFNEAWQTLHRRFEQLATLPLEELSNDAIKARLAGIAGANESIRA
jgi:arsenate reductase